MTYFLALLRVGVTVGRETSDASPGIRALALLRARLRHKRLAWTLAGLGFVLSLPSLAVGWQVDDHAMRLTLFGGPTHLDMASKARFEAINKLFLFVDGVPEDVRWGMDVGSLPWWSSPELEINFWRPISAFTHWLDYRLFPDVAWPMHVHSLLWYGLLLMLVLRHYRQLLGTSSMAAGLAAFMYTIDDARAFAISWICNRNAIITMALGLLSLGLHVRWRRDGYARGAVLAPLVFGLSLLAGEAAVGTLAYLAAFALFMDKAPWTKRALTLVPYAVLLVIWRVAYLAMGYRAYESGWYVDPGVEPLRFLGLVFERAPILLLGQWLAPPSDVTMFAQDGLPAMLLALALPFLAFVGWMLWPLVRRSQEAKFWAAGMLLSLVPVCATQPMDRLLFFPGLGAFGLLSLFLMGVWERAAWLPRARNWRLWSVRAMKGAVAVHLLAGFIGFPLRSYVILPVWENMQESMEAHSADAGIAQQDLLVLTAPNGFVTGYMPVIRSLEQRPMPEHIRWLAPCQNASEILREDAQTIRMSVAGGFPPDFSSMVSRDWARPMSRGDRVELTGFSAEVLSIGKNGHPESVRFRFGESLESPRYRWLHWTENGFERLKLPRVGQSISLPGVTWPF
jgi:hypothetical protein